MAVDGEKYSIAYAIVIWFYVIYVGNNLPDWTFHKSYFIVNIINEWF